MAVSWNPTIVTVGAFSDLSSLAKNALRELGETNPDVVIANELVTFHQYGNRIIHDVNTHPYYRDLIEGAFTDTTGDMTSGDNTLTITGTNPGILRGTPVVVAGAGFGGGDLYTTALDSVDSNNAILLADAAMTTVAAAVVASPYKFKIRQYTKIDGTEDRAIDDRVMVEGLKFYYALDEVFNTNQTAVSLYDSVYWKTLSMWIADAIGAYGELHVEIRD